jgi:hypothetical protein
MFALPGRGLASGCSSAAIAASSAASSAWVRRGTAAAASSDPSVAAARNAGCGACAGEPHRCHQRLNADEP